ncbi:unnamed protein product [Brassicogethes aeneus]|uniref:Elongation factor 1-delta n=1 Tax=Brassicogethes aeneus TaxID=1431903 RepID=A0A9P0BFT6_BRAAE|nr:unnamed protein product [Brassicogethes aeneus]
MKHSTASDVWLAKPIYDDAETSYYEGLAKGDSSLNLGAVKLMEKMGEYEKVITQILDRLSLLEKRCAQMEQTAPKADLPKVSTSKNVPVDCESEGSDVDLFGSDSDGENDDAAKLREERLAAYAAKKSKKPALIAKSNVIFDVKPWDDETDMKAMEVEVKKITHDGLLWGSSKLVPLAYGIHKLQIATVVEDDKVSIDWLQEQIESIEDYVQSVDIAAFNKI